MKQPSPYLEGADRLPAGMRLFVALLLVLSFIPWTMAARADDGPEPTILERTVTPAGVNTVIEIPVFQDTFLSSANPNTNYGSSTSLNLGYTPSLGAMRMMLQFDLGSIPQDAIVNSAKFRIYQYGATPQNDGPMGFQAQYVKTGWNESQVTWNNANYLGGASIPVGQLSSGLGWNEFDVTQVIHAWVSGDQPNYGAIVTGDEAPERDRSRYFYSGEQGGFSPRLIVDYTAACDSTPPTASVNALPGYSPGTFTVSWSGFDSAPPGCQPGGIAYYDVQYRISGSGWSDWQIHTPATSGTFNFAPNGTFVEFRVRAVDRAGNVQAYGGPQAGTNVDSAPPFATVNPLPQYTISPSFQVTWGGSDNLSGIAYYDVQVRIDGGQWQWLVQQTVQTSYLVTGGQTGSTYEFRARATDTVGNVQPWSETAQAVTVVFAHPVSVIQPFNPPILKPTAPITHSFTVNWVGYFAPGTTITGYSIYYNYNNQGWQLWAAFPGSQTSALFNWVSLGLGDGLYAFEVVATNNLGQSEPRKPQAEAFIIVDMANRFQPRVYLPLVFKPVY